MKTQKFEAFSIENFPVIHTGDSLVPAITNALRHEKQRLEDGDIVIIASKVVSISEGRRVDLSTVTPSDEAEQLSIKTGKPAGIAQLILNESVEHFLATPTGPIIARHKLGYCLTSAGIDRDGDGGAWLLPADPDLSARGIRDQLQEALGVRVAVIIADSDGRADRLGSCVISIGAAGIAPLRHTEFKEPNGQVKRQEETLTDMIAGAAGILLGQRGRGAPIAVIRGISYQHSDDGVRSILHKLTAPIRTFKRDDEHSSHSHDLYPAANHGSRP